jgi:TrmH family RNA methyltransferase
MGAHFVLAIHEQQALAEVAAKCKTVIATTLSATQSIYAADLTGRVAFVFGNEGAGLSPELLAHATCQVTIPMPGKIESLNVAAAAAICLFERVRQLQQR